MAWEAEPRMASEDSSVARIECVWSDGMAGRAKELLAGIESSGK